MNTDKGQRLVVALLACGLSMASGHGVPALAHAGAGASLRGGRGHAPRPWSEGRGQPLARALSATLPLSGTSWTQQAELTATTQSFSDGFGNPVAIWGNTAAVGAPETPYPALYGAVYLFTRTVSGAWSQQAELLDPGYGVSQGDSFGYALALQGNTLAIGAPGVRAGLGAVYIYGRSGSTWTQQAVITPTDAMQPESFATALALSGNTLVVGAYGAGSGGAIYIYVRSGSTWTQQAEFAYPGHVYNAEFGWSVGVWGNSVVVGAPLAPVAFLYARSGTTWVLQAVLSAPHPSYLFFGNAVALWGTTALVGGFDQPFLRPGAVWVFTRSGTTWTHQATLSPPPGTPGGLFGSSVALSGDTAVIGGLGVYVWVGQGATWAQQAQLMPSNQPAGNLSVAAVYGNTAIAGVTNLMGSAYVFVRSGASWAADGTPGHAEAGARPRVLVTGR